jgi:hypothetical protein
MKTDKERVREALAFIDPLEEERDDTEATWRIALAKSMMWTKINAGVWVAGFAMVMITHAHLLAMIAAVLVPVATTFVRQRYEGEERDASRKMWFALGKWGGAIHGASEFRKVAGRFECGE